MQRMFGSLLRTKYSRGEHSKTERNVCGRDAAVSVRKHKGPLRVQYQLLKAIQRLVTLSEQRWTSCSLQVVSVQCLQMVK